MEGVFSLVVEHMVGHLKVENRGAIVEKGSHFRSGHMI